MILIVESSVRHEGVWARLDGVDLLRGLAIFFVLLNHVNMRLLFADVPYTRGLPKQLVSSLVWNGQPGVQMFFAISGFLITSTALRRWGSLAAVGIADFYRLRFARIAPLLLLLLAVLSICHLTRMPGFVVSSKTGGLGRALLAALTFHVNVLEARRGYLPGNWDILWSLSVEEVFYLLFPIVATVACRLTGKVTLLLAILSGFVVLGPIARTLLTQGNPVWREYSYLGGMDAIAMGCLTAILLWRRSLAGWGLKICGSLGALLLIFSLAFSPLAESFGLYRTGLDMSVLAIGACLSIAAFASTGWRSPRLLLPVIQLGRRSYEIYLTHMFVVLGCFAIFVQMGKPLFGVPVLFLSVILLSCLFGEFVARFYSEPANRLLRKGGKDGHKGGIGSVIDQSGRPSIPRDKLV